MKDVAEKVIKFSKWVESDLPQTITSEQMLFAEDMGELFIDTTKDNKSVRVSIQCAAARS